MEKSAQQSQQRIKAAKDSAWETGSGSEKGEMREAEDEIGIQESLKNNKKIGKLNVGIRTIDEMQV